MPTNTISGLFPVMVLAAVFILIAIRQVGRFRFRIWQVMLGGAAVVLLTGQITPEEALYSINGEVMLFLFGMFIVGEAMDRSGYLRSLTYHLFSRVKSGEQFILFILLGMGLLSALLMNDTLAIIGTPLVLAYACRFGVSPKAALIALCFAVTIGSAMSPVGNPQNLLIVSYGRIPQPFVTFFLYLGIPTLVNLMIAFFLLRFCYQPGKDRCAIGKFDEPAGDPTLAGLSRIALGVILLLIAVRVISGADILPLSVIALSGAFILLFFSRERFSLVRGIDWPTLVFFASMFVLMQSVYESGFFQAFADFSSFTSVPVIVAASVVISQFISNVPFVALFQPAIMQSGLTMPEMMALAAGSTIAGNLTVLGAASNIIVIQNAERMGQTITFREFFRIGFPLTLLNSVVYAGFLILVS